jgi:hypothetical protein
MRSGVVWRIVRLVGAVAAQRIAGLLIFVITDVWMIAQQMDGMESRRRLRRIQEKVDRRTGEQQVQALFRDCEKLAEVAVVTESALHLQRGYLDAGIVGPQWNADALHVALATASRCSLIVSWNFKHIVSYKRIPLYNKVNVGMGHAHRHLFSLGGYLR